MNLELLIFTLIFLLCLILIFQNFKASMVLLLILSVFLHKELFELYRWDLMPIRAIMLVYSVFGLLKVLSLFKTTKNLSQSIHKIVNFCKEPYVLLLLLIFISKVTSLLFTKNLVASIAFVGFFATVTILGIILFVYLKNKPGTSLFYIKVYTVVVFLSCIFGYFQFFIYEKYHVLIGAIWNIPNNLPRIGALFWDVNHFGALLAALMPVLGVFLLTGKTLKTKALYLLMFLSMLGILILTNSRTAWLTAFVSFLIFLIILFVKRFGVRGVLSIFLALVLFSLPFTFMYMDRSSPFRALVRNYFHYRMDSFDSHILLLRGTFEIFNDYPIFGSGVGSFFEHFSDTKVAAEYFSRDPAALNTRVPAHTIWGELASETGIVGLSLFILFITINMFNLLYISLKESEKGKFLLSSAMFSAIFGLLVAGIFYSYNSEFFWLILFLYFMYGIGTLGKDYNVSKIVKYFVTQTPLPTLFLFAVSFILLFWNLGTNHLIPWDEAIYANISKNMASNGNYLMQFWKPLSEWYEKPPFYMWFTALFMNLFGQNAWAIRLPSAIMGFGTLVAVYLFGKWLFKTKSADFSNKTVGFIATLCLLTTVHFLYYSRLGMLDVTATFFLATSLFTYYIAKALGQKKLWIVAGILCGVSVMTKGVIGFVPVPIIALYELYLFLTKQQKLSLELRKLYITFSAVVFIIAAPWHLYMSYTLGLEFWNKYLGYHVISRAIVPIEDKGRPFLWYLDVLRVSMRLWFLALIGALPFSLFLVLRKFSSKFNFDFVKNLLEGYEGSEKQHFNLINAHVFLLIWITFVFLFFSAAASKLVWYVIPIYPAASILIGFFLERVINTMMQLVPQFKTPIFKPLCIFLMLCVVFTYLFIYRNMAYPSDLTGSQTELIVLKDKLFGTKTNTYADRIDLPLLLYYSKSPFEIVDFGPLRFKLTQATSYDEDVYFITKESRLRSYREILPQIILQAQIKEWVLGYLPSAYSIDKSALKDIQEEKSEILGDSVRLPQNRLRLNQLLQDETKLQDKIERGLQTLIIVQ